MSLEYLAMYIEVQFEMGAVENPIVPVRHFASSRLKLGEAVKSGDLFTDISAADSEWDLITNGAKEISVLFDSTLPGREKIIKGNAKRGFAQIVFTMFIQEQINASKPSITRPGVSGFSLFYGMKTVSNQYPKPILDVTTWRKFFTKPGRYIELSGPTFERNSAVFGTNSFEAMTFRNWNVMIIDH